jgi:hypothetical protein
VVEQYYDCYLARMGDPRVAPGVGKERAFGRSLSDFPEPSDAEKIVIAAARVGEFATLGDRRPVTEEERKTRTVRAGLVRFLALGGDDVTSVHERGVLISGAVIEGHLNLDGCTLEIGLTLVNCELTHALTLRRARTRTVSLMDTHCQGISADGADISGALFLSGDFAAAGAVRLNGLKISGPLVCEDGKFDGRDNSGYALSCDGIDADGYVFLRRAHVSRGSVSFLRAKIVRNLECQGGLFEGNDNEGHSIIFASVQVDGNLFLNYGFRSAASVLLVGAQIGGDVVCVAGDFGAVSLVDGAEAHAKKIESTYRAKPRIALDLDRATVRGTLWLGKSASFHGGVDLTGARITRIVDMITEDEERGASDDSSADTGETPEYLCLDGLVYEGFGEETDLSGSARTVFLQLQRPEDLGEQFKPQPWIQMVKVLRDTGHADAARQVAIAYEDTRRAAGNIPSPIGKLLHWLYGLLVGYGHRPLQLLRITLARWLLCAATYFTAAELGVMAPTNPRVFYEPKHESCRPENGGNWTTCLNTPYEYTTFNPWIYSLDLMLPFVDLQQDRDWAPMKRRPCAVTKSIWVTDICWQSAVVAKARGESFVVKPAYWISGTIVSAVMWFEILFGWAASLLLAAVLSGLAKRLE